MSGKTIKEAGHQRGLCVLVPAQQWTKQKYLIMANSLTAVNCAEQRFAYGISERPKAGDLAFCLFSVRAILTRKYVNCGIMAIPAPSTKDRWSMPLRPTNPVHPGSVMKSNNFMRSRGTEPLGHTLDTGWGTFRYRCGK
jgi:hypothetical protein